VGVGTRDFRSVRGQLRAKWYDEWEFEPVLWWLCVALGVAFGSALLPLLSIELFLIALASQQPDIPWLALGAVIAVGQVAGKLIYYYAGRGKLHLPAFLHRKPRNAALSTPSARRARWALRTKRIRAWLEVLRERCHRHPRWMVGTYGLSSVLGLPPFMATTVLAGLVRMRLATFLSAGLIGRFIRFSILAAAPAVFAGLL
jgi:membrane protein YqaA with SNARE-associated domain